MEITLESIRELIEKTIAEKQTIIKPVIEEVKPPEIKVEVDYTEIIKQTIAQETSKIQKQMEISNNLSMIEKSIPVDKKALWDSMKAHITAENLLKHYEESKAFYTPANGSYQSTPTQNEQNIDKNQEYKTGEIADIYEINENMLDWVSDDINVIAKKEQAVYVALKKGVKRGSIMNLELEKK